ncbi:MAG: hypothetical protein AABY22_26475 [Nanoarchaeota archaeon]
MKKQDRIQVVEEHTMWNSKVIFALFCLILIFGIVTGIGFYNIKQQIPKGEWECIEYGYVDTTKKDVPLDCTGTFNVSLENDTIRIMSKEKVCIKWMLIRKMNLIKQKYAI